MATTDAEMLALVNAVITKRLNGDAYTEYSEAEQRFKGASIKELYDIRKALTNDVNKATTGQIRLARIHRA